MVDTDIRTEILLELTFCATGEVKEQMILKKSIPVYLRKLNCFQACVLKYNNKRLEERMVIPYVTSKSTIWNDVRNYFSNWILNAEELCGEFYIDNSYYYGYNLDKYGILILGRKKPFDYSFKNNLVLIVTHLGRVLMQSNEIEQKEKADKLLKDSEQRLLNLSNSTTAGIVISYLDKFEYANSAAERISGYSIEELNYLSITDIIHPDFKDLLKKRLVGKIKGQEQNSHFELKIINKKGEECWIDMNIGLIDWMGKDADIYSVFDISKKKQTLKELIVAKERAEESDRLKASFLANLSHEVRTPLNSIMGFASLLTGEFSNEFSPKYASIIVDSSEQLVSIIDDIVYYSKLQTTSISIQRNPFNVYDLFVKIKESFNLPIYNGGVELLLYRDQDKDLIANSDLDKIRQLLTNLISNSFKYTITGEIEFGCIQKEGDLEFFVRDTGIGIDDNEQELIFNRFYRGRNIDQCRCRGTGLGLSIITELVALLGGKVYVNSILGVGSCFYFTIPLN